MKLQHSYIRFITTLLLGHLFVGYTFAQVPSLPANFYVIALDGNNELHWNANPGVESVTDYKIYRSEDRAIFSPIATISATPSPTYLDNGLENGKQYFYKIAAINVSGEGASSKIDAGVPQKDLGRFIQFNGNDSAAVANSDQLQLNATSFTIEFWLRIKDLPFPGNEGYLFTRYRSDNMMTYVVRVMPSGKLEFRLVNLLYGVSTTEVLSPNRWYHIAVTYIKNAGPTTNTAKIFINGVPSTVVKSANVYDAISSPGGKVILGADAIATNRFFSGYMDELRVWNYSRTQTQITDNLCVRTRGDEAGLIGLWHFDELNKINSPKVYDYSINNYNTGVNVNTTVFTPIANPDSKIINYGTPAVIKVQGNDVNYSNTKKITTSIIPGYPLYGTTSIVNKDSLNYTPKAGFSGVDTIKYILADTASYCSSPPKYDTASVVVYVPCSQKDNLNWAKRSIGQSALNTTFIEKGLFTRFSTSDVDNIVSKIEVAKDFQYLNSIVWQQDPSNKSQQSKVTLAFNKSIDQFCFKLIDIDYKASGYTDSVVVNAYYNGQLINLSNRDLDLGSAVSFSGNNSLKGISLVDDAAAANGNASICYYTLIDSIQITFTNAANAPNNPQSQNIGIGDFSWCALPNHTPVIVDNNEVSIDTLEFTVFENQPYKTCFNLRDENQDSVFVSSAISSSILGKVNILSYRCIEYVPKKDYRGTELFEIMACDNRTPSLCYKIILRVKVVPLCVTQSQLRWSDYDGQDPKDRAYNKEGLITRISSRAHSHVASSMKVGKKFYKKSSIGWKQNGANKNENSDVIIAFNQGVSQFSFDLYDLDKENVNSTDSLIVNAYNNGTLIDLSASNIKFIGSVVSFLGNNAFKGTADTDDDTSEEGNVSITYFVPVDSVVLRFTNAASSGSGNANQEIGIGNLNWCTIPNMAPEIIDNDGINSKIITLSTQINTPLDVCLRVEDINLDSIQIAEIIPINSKGEMINTAPDTCLHYTPKQNFIGVDSFEVKVCDNRIPPLCSQVKIIINVLPATDATLFISQGLSPNGDNILDYWVIQGIENYPNSKVQVFNVWGDLIYQQSNYQNEVQAWRGEANRGKALGGERAPDGTYYYVLNLGDGSPVRKGYVMLKR